MIAWTLPNSQRGLASIRLRGPIAELTREQMMAALWSRIDRLIRQETPRRARALLRQYEDQEGFSLDQATAGQVLAENSERLWEALGAPDWPIKGPLEHDPATARRLEQETLEEFLAELYPAE
jgi:hypothetical protein